MSDYTEYVKKYARDHEILEEEAETHLMVKGYKDYIKERDRDMVDGTHNT